MLYSLHHIEELEPVNDTVSVLVDLFEHLSDLFVGDVAMAHAMERILELSSVDGAVAVRVVPFERLDHFGDLLRVKVLFVREGHVVGFVMCLWVCFDHADLGG